MAPSPLSPRHAIRRYQKIAVLAVLALFGGLGGWAAYAPIQGAVVVTGTVVVETNTKRIQHLEGGLIAEIAVGNGQRVEAGELLVRLDATELRTSLHIVETQLEEYLAQRARLAAERAGALKIDRAAAGPASDQNIWDAQQSLLMARHNARKGRREQSLERIAQLHELIKGLNAQNAARVQQEQLTRDELDAVSPLEKKKLITLNRISVLRRELARTEGEVGQTAADIARYRVQISEIRSKIFEDEYTWLSEVLNELREVESKIAEALEKRSAMQAKLKRVNVIAPRSGLVHNLNVHTIGGVVRPGETMMEIVPEEDVLVIEGKVATIDRDRLSLGQAATLRLSALDQRRTPELMGQVTRISPDAHLDKDSNSPPYFLIRIELREGELARLGDKRLVPGMSAEIFIETGERTVLDYLAKPMLDQIAHAFRDK